MRQQFSDFLRANGGPLILLVIGASVRGLKSAIVGDLLLFVGIVLVLNVLVKSRGSKTRLATVVLSLIAAVAVLGRDAGAWSWSDKSLRTTEQRTFEPLQTGTGEVDYLTGGDCSHRSKVDVGNPSAQACAFKAFKRPSLSNPTWTVPSSQPSHDPCFYETKSGDYYCYGSPWSAPDAAISDTKSIPRHSISADLDTSKPPWALELRNHWRCIFSFAVLYGPPSNATYFCLDRKQGQAGWVLGLPVRGSPLKVQVESFTHTLLKHDVEVRVAWY